MVINNLSGFDSICGSRSNLGCLKITEYHGKPLQLLFTDSEWLILPDFHGGIGAAFFVQVAILHHGPVERRMLLECSCPSLGTPETWFSRQQLDSSQLWKNVRSWPSYQTPKKQNTKVYWIHFVRKHQTSGSEFQRPLRHGDSWCRFFIFAYVCGSIPWMEQNKFTSCHWPNS